MGGAQDAFDKALVRREETVMMEWGWIQTAEGSIRKKAEAICKLTVKVEELEQNLARGAAGGRGEAADWCKKSILPTRALFQRRVETRQSEWSGWEDATEPEQAWTMSGSMFGLRAVERCTPSSRGCQRCCLAPLVRSAGNQRATGPPSARTESHSE